MKTPSQKRRYALLNRRLAGYVMRVQEIYESLNKKAAKIAVDNDVVDSSEPFSFSQYPNTKRKVEDLQASFFSSMRGLIMSGTSKEWEESNHVQDLLANDVLRAYGVRKNDERRTHYYQVNSEQLKAFQERKDRGMNLSQKIWNQSKEYKEELEAAIGTAIEKGIDAITLSKRISKYLNDFPRLKADYKEKFGTATSVHDCEYRSIRLARSEINMAYRKAEQERWKQFDFVVGYEIKLSGSHPKEDICDRLAGKYPKDFDWTGWHPNDMCYKVSILKTEEEFWAEDSEITQSKNEVTDVPEAFKEYVYENQKKLKDAEFRDTLPYVFRDNMQYVRMILADYEKPMEATAGVKLPNVDKETQRQIDIAVSTMPKSQRFSADYNDYVEAYRKAAKALDIDIEEFEKLYRNDKTHFYDIDKAMARTFLARGKEGETLKAMTDHYFGRDSVEVHERYRAQVLDYRFERSKTTARQALEYAVRENEKFFERGTRAYELLYGSTGFLGQIDKYTIYRYDKEYLSVCEELYRIATRVGDKELASHFATMINGGGNVYGIEGTRRFPIKFDGINKMSMHREEYVANYLTTPSTTNYGAEAKCRALMPTAVKYVDFQGGKGYGNVKNGLMYMRKDLSGIIDEITTSLYHNMSMNPKMVDGITFVGHNHAEYNLHVDAITRYCLDKGLSKNSFPDIKEREVFIRRLIITGQNDAGQSVTYMRTRMNAEKEKLKRRLGNSSSLEEIRAIRKEINEWDEKIEAINFVCGLHRKNYTFSSGTKCDFAGRFGIGYGNGAYASYGSDYYLPASYGINVKGIVLNYDVCDDMTNWIVENVKVGKSPKGCGSIEAYFNHECGHKHDSTFNFYLSDEFRSLRKPTVKEISSYPFEYNGISRDKELIAEAWSEYTSSDNPRPYAVSVGTLLEKKIGVNIFEYYREFELAKSRVKEKNKKKSKIFEN